MKIEHVHTVTIHYVTDDDGLEYKRYGPDSWHWVIGMSEEDTWGDQTKRLEARFQAALPAFEKKLTDEVLDERRSAWEALADE